MTREQFAGGIYYLITKKSTVDESNPLMIVIENEALKIRDSDLESFYTFFAGNEKYINAGFTTIEGYKKAIREFNNGRLDRFWRESGAGARAAYLYEKLIGINLMIPTPIYTDKLKDVCDRYQEKLDGFKRKDTQEKLFDDKEKEIIGEIGLFAMIEKIRNEGREAFREYLFGHIRHKLTLHLFGVSEQHKKIGHSGGSKNLPTSSNKSNENEIAPKVVDILSTGYREV